MLADTYDLGRSSEEDGEGRLERMSAIPGASVSINQHTPKLNK